MIDDGMKAMQQILTKLANKVIAHYHKSIEITLVDYYQVKKKFTLNLKQVLRSA